MGGDMALLLLQMLVCYQADIKLPQPAVRFYLFKIHQVLYFMLVFAH